VRLETLLLKASHRREIWRASMEPDLEKAAQTGSSPSTVLVDNIVTRYENGVADPKVVFHATADNATFTWLD